MPIMRIPVCELMDDPVFVSEDDNLLTIIKRLLSTKKGCVLVNNKKGETIGIISDRDIQRLILREGGLISPAITAKEFMVKPVITGQNTLSLAEADQIMHHHKINRLPIVEKEGSKKVIGIVNYETVHANLITTFAKSWIERNRTYQH
ncbi:MAG: hypothetical protein DRP02_06590 [Candidatus Gerdarchaeota archaeon]|nr:MAG: hypothetical protein DRO63_03860 [Candidatus Gerdarchaeota archaeon]RLI70870.1 MAG: hypothetical protein DRP02_06590 [Candidatus Gerdarchaeota archaeon]